MPGMTTRQFTPEILQATYQADTRNLRSLITLHDLLAQAANTGQTKNCQVEDARREATVILERLILGRLDDAHGALARVGRLIQGSLPAKSAEATSNPSTAD